MVRQRIRLLLTVAVVSAGCGFASLANGATPVDPLACPISSLSESLPWLTSQYQSRFTTAQLGAQVVNCEESLNASNAVAAEVALTSLRFVTGDQWQNQNNWLALTGQSFRYIDDFNRLGIPSITLEDGPIGIRFQKSPAPLQATLFPNEITVAASMDPTVASAYGSQLASEASAMNFQGIQAPDLNIDRVPTWGRASETFGENPTLAGLLGAAQLQAQLEQIPFVVLKHFGPYGQENSRRTLNTVISDQALFENYLRPFAMARTGADTALARNRTNDVLMMCSYGDVGGTQSCVSSRLREALADFGFTGLVRSDLDVKAGVGALYNAGVSLIKPQGALNLTNLNGLTPGTKQALHDAAVRVVAEMFQGGLVTPTSVTERATGTSMTNALHNQGLDVANNVERRGAVLLKNDNSFFPLSRTGTTAIVALRDLRDTCQRLARSLSSAGSSVTCTSPNLNLSGGTRPFGTLSATAPKATKKVSVVTTLPATGSYLVQLSTLGNTTLSIGGGVALQVAGTTEFPCPAYTTITGTAHQSISMSLSWSGSAPTVSLIPLTGLIASVKAATSSATRVIIMANDVGREGADRATLELPYGMDAVIKAVATQKPTAVALFTTGPVTMPWLSSVAGVYEFWNPPGDSTIDVVMSRLVPALSDLITGAATPTGHLPITFPASQQQSPASRANQNFWPGVKEVVRLSSSPLSGRSLGFDWYQRANWNVLFPFGYGLTYGNVTQTFASGDLTCAVPTTTTLCLKTQTRVSLPSSVTNFSTVTQLYVAPPASSGQPTLLFGGVGPVTCRTTVSGVTTNSPTCQSGTTNITVTNLGVGAWNSDASAFQFVSGCYTFIVASDAKDAYDTLASPASGSHVGRVLNATAPFTSATTFSTGACPKS